MASGYYDIINKTLGKGHYGVVKLGRHCLTGEPVALKIIEKSRLNKHSLHQLGTEIRILFRLSEYEHPNILKLYQTIDTDDKLFLVTEYCGPHACDLHDYISRKHSRDGLSEKEAQIFFIQICSAISYCHSMGIVHRDLKPENILVTDYRYTLSDSSDPTDSHHSLLKLIDFGFANQWFQDEKMSTSCGTLAYSAPELLLGEMYDGTKVDVWGLGLMLYILLYGVNPFMQITDYETLTKILDCSFATPAKDNVNQNAIELLRSLIKRNPETRMPIELILEHKWISDLSKPLGIQLNVQPNADQPCPMKQTCKLTPITGPALPPISEIGPLKNLNRSVDDDQIQSDPNVSKDLPSNYNRTRSLSITRLHSRANQQQSLPKTRSSITLDGSNQTGTTRTYSFSSARGQSIYRPTSPDVGGMASLTEDEKNLHEKVIQEICGLTKLIDSKSSIEASLKNARFLHREFNQNSIKPTEFNRNLSSDLVKTLSQIRQSASSGACKVEEVEPDLEAVTEPKKVIQDRPTTINSKLSNDDYIYATYQLTRDRILRVRQNQQISKLVSSSGDGSAIKRDGLPDWHADINTTQLESRDDTQSTNLDRAEPRKNSDSDVANPDMSSSKEAKENDEGGRSGQRKPLQPQHRMRDKFTSFFRSGSSSPNDSFSLSNDTPSNIATELSSPTSMIQGINHEAFNDHSSEMSSSTSSASRYFVSKADTCESALACSLPLARKCSLVSEESVCSNEIGDNQ